MDFTNDIKENTIIAYINRICLDIIGSWVQTRLHNELADDSIFVKRNFLNNYIENILLQGYSKHNNSILSSNPIKIKVSSLFSQISLMLFVPYRVGDTDDNSIF